MKKCGHCKRKVDKVYKCLCLVYEWPTNRKMKDEPNYLINSSVSHAICKFCITRKYNGHFPFPIDDRLSPLEWAAISGRRGNERVLAGDIWAIPKPRSYVYPPVPLVDRDGKEVGRVEF